VESNGNQRPFLKTCEHTFVVSKPSVEINGNAWMTPVDSERVNINIGVDYDSSVAGLKDLEKFRAYTEVYGVAEDGTIKSASWLGSVVNVNVDSSGTPYFSLQLNLKWLANANVKGPITLKNTYLADGATQYPSTAFDSDIIVKNSNIQKHPLYQNGVMNLRGPLEITSEMKFGVNPLKKVNLNATGTPNLFLLHGYCSDANPFHKNSQVFTDAAYFLNPGANVNNDDFANKVYQYAETHGSEIFSLIGHSQGGMASLHLLNAYWSGLDHTTEGSRVQSVGTPWLGNSAAGTLANLGKLFGISCGYNNDLTTDGALNWLSGIHEDHPQYVDYYTTTYKLGNLLGDYCNFAINAILQWPNDGTSEAKYTKLPGGNNMGNKEKWCHTASMKYQPQYNDNIRNEVMNKNAARR